MRKVIPKLQIKPVDVWCVGFVANLDYKTLLKEGIYLKMPGPGSGG